jgi:hypothetical protein
VEQFSHPALVARQPPYIRTTTQGHLKDEILSVWTPYPTTDVDGFTGWCARRVAVHRALGLFGAVLAASMVVLGLAAATNSLARGFAPPGFPNGARGFYALPVFEILTFMTLIGAGLWMRSNGPAHKRLVLLATIILLDAAFTRWPFAIMRRGHILVEVVLVLMVLLICAFAFGPFAEFIVQPCEVAFS